jgi:TP901 family phage tail tape measure protein
MAFNINAQVILSGPKNIRAVTKQIKTQLQGITVPVNITIDKNIAKNLGNFNKGVRELTGNLNLLESSSKRADASIRSLVAGFRELSNSSGKIASSQASVATSLKGSTQSMHEARNELQAFGKDAALAIRRFTAFTVATGVVFGFVRAISKATGAAIDYEREIVKVVQVTGASVGKIGQLKKTIDDLSVSLGVDANELASLARIFSQTGQSIDQVRDSIRSVARSSLAPSFGEMKNTAEGLIAAMAQFNIAADKSEQVLGALNAVSKKFAVESEDLISVIRRAGGVFSTAAGQMKDPQQALNELIGLFTAVRSTTRESADTIATGLRTIFTRIQRRGTIEFLRGFNIELLDAKGNFVGLFPAFEKLSAGLKSLVQSGDAVKLSAVTEELGGIRQVGKLIPTIVNFNKALEATKVASQGAAAGLGRDVGLALQPLGKQLEIVASRFGKLIRTISESKTFQNLAKIAISTANAFLSVAEALTPLIPLITTLATIKITRGLFQFGQGFVGGLKKGQGAEGLGGVAGTLARGGAGGGGAAALKPSGGERLLATALKENVTSLRTNTAGLTKVGAVITQSSTRFATGATSIVTSNTNLVGSITNLIVAINRDIGNRGIGGFRPPRKFARGGPVSGPSHAQGGVLAELEGGEYVLPRGYPIGSFGGVRGLALEERRQAALQRQKSGRQGEGSTQRLTKGREDPAFAGFTEAGKTKGSIVDPNSVQSQKARKAVVAKLKKLERTELDTYGGAFLSSPSGPPQGKLIGSLKPDEIMKALQGSNKIYTAIAGTRGAKGGPLQSFRNQIKSIATKKSDFTLAVGILKEALAKQIEEIIVGNVENAVATGATTLAGSIGAKPSTKTGTPEMAKILKSANIDNVIGNIFEAVVANSGVPYSVKDNDAPNAPFDFPKGLGARAASFGRPELGLATTQTDAKTRYTADNISKFKTKVKNAEAKSLEDAILDAFSGQVGLLGPVNQQALLGEFSRSGSKNSITSVKDIVRARRKGTQFKAAGGSIFAPRGTDTVPAMLTPGEYVINRKSAQSIGYGQLDKMNRLAAGGPVQYFPKGRRVMPVAGATTTTQSSSGVEDATDTLTNKFGAAAIAITSMTAAISGMDFSSMQSALISAGSLALTFAQLQFFLRVDMISKLGGLVSGLPAVGALKGAFATGTKTFGLARQGRRASGAWLPGVNSAASGRALGGGFTGFLKSAGKGLSAFKNALGPATGLVKGFGLAIVAAIADPLIDASIDSIFGEIKEITPGIRGRAGATLDEARRAGAAGGTAKGALTGAAIASLIPIPVISTAIGAAVGAAVGGVMGALKAEEDQRVFNSFIRLEKAGNQLAKSFELIEKSGGDLGRQQQTTFEEDLRGFQRHLSGAGDRLTEFATEYAGPAWFERGGIMGKDDTAREAARSRFADPGIGDMTELGNLISGEGEGLKAVEERRNFLSSPKIKEQIKEAETRLDQNAASLLQRMSTEAAAAITEINIPKLSDEIAAGRAPVTGPEADVSIEIQRRRTLEPIEEFLRVLPPSGLTGQGALDVARSIDAIAMFDKLNNQLKELEGGGNAAAGSLRKIRDQRLFLAISQGVEKQSRAFQRAGERLKQANLEIGLGILQDELGGLANLSEKQLGPALDVAVKATREKTKGTIEESEAIRKLVLGHITVSLERANEHALLALTAKTLKDTEKSLLLFSLAIKNLGDTTKNASADFSIAASNISGDIQGILGGAPPQSDVFGRFQGSDSQLRLIEQGGPQAKQLQSLVNLQKKLPDILRRTIKEGQRREKAPSEETLTEKQLQDILKEQLEAAGDVPEVVFKQLVAALRGGSRQGGGALGAIADPLLRYTAFLEQNAYKVEGMSEIIEQAAKVAEQAFADINKVFKSYRSVIEQGIKVEEKAIGRRLQVITQEEQAQDRLSRIRGGTGRVTVEEARRRRTRKGFGALGLDPRAADSPFVSKGIEVGGKALLAMRTALITHRKTLERQLKETPSGESGEKTLGALVHNSAHLSRVNKALEALGNDTTELTAAMNALEQTVQLQIKAEQSIGTISDAIADLASGKITPFEFHDRVGVPIGAFEKLREATLTGKEQAFTFKEVDVLRKGLSGQNPILEAAFQTLAKQATDPGGRAGAGRFALKPQLLLAELRADFTKLLGQSALQTLAGRGGGHQQTQAFLLRALEQLNQTRMSAKPGGRQAAEVQRVLDETRNLAEAANLSDQQLFANQMGLASKAFQSATAVFAEAVANFESAVATPKPIRQFRPPGGGGPRGGPETKKMKLEAIRNYMEVHDITEGIPSMKEGGPVRGLSHAQGGVIAELEGGEYVIPKRQMSYLKKGSGRTRISPRQYQEEKLLDQLREEFGDNILSIGAKKPATPSDPPPPPVPRPLPPMNPPAPAMPQDLPRLGPADPSAPPVPRPLHPMNPPAPAMPQDLPRLGPADPSAPPVPKNLPVPRIPRRPGRRPVPAEVPAPLPPAVAKRNARIRKRNEDNNKARVKRGMRPFQLHPVTGRLLRGEGGRILHEDEEWQGPSGYVRRSGRRIVKRDAIGWADEARRRGEEIGPPEKFHGSQRRQIVRRDAIGWADEARRDGRGTTMSDLVDPVSRGRGTAYSGRYGGLRRRPMFPAGRRSGYSRISTGRNPGANELARRGQQRRSGNKRFEEIWNRPVTRGDLQRRFPSGPTTSRTRSTDSPRETNRLRRIVETEGQPSSRFGLPATGGFGPSLRGMMALKSLKELQTGADDRPFAVSYRRFIAALYRKAQRGDPDALRVLMRIQEMKRNDTGLSRGPADTGRSRVTDDLSFPGDTSQRLNLLRNFDRRPPTPAVDRGRRGTGWTLQRQEGGVVYAAGGLMMPQRGTTGHGTNRTGSITYDPVRWKQFPGMRTNVSGQEGWIHEEKDARPIWERFRGKLPRTQMGGKKVEPTFMESMSEPDSSDLLNPLGIVSKPVGTLIGRLTSGSLKTKPVIKQLRNFRAGITRGSKARASAKASDAAYEQYRQLTAGLTPAEYRGGGWADVLDDPNALKELFSGDMDIMNYPKVANQVKLLGSDQSAGYFGYKGIEDAIEKGLFTLPEGMSIEQMQAIVAHGSARNVGDLMGSAELKDILRTGKPLSGSALQTVNLLDSIRHRIPNKLHSGMDAVRVDGIVSQVGRLDESAIGKTFKVNEYVSGTTSREVAQSFGFHGRFMNLRDVGPRWTGSGYEALEYSGGLEKYYPEIFPDGIPPRVVLDITTKGEGVRIGNAIGQAESESLLRRGSKFKITGLGTPAFQPSGAQGINLKVRQQRRGGLIYANAGGSIFKPKGTDTIPAMLTQGEFVVRRDAVNAVGLDTMRSINSMGPGGGGGPVNASQGGLINYLKHGGPPKVKKKKSWWERLLGFMAVGQMHDSMQLDDLKDLIGEDEIPNAPRPPSRKAPREDRPHMASITPQKKTRRREKKPRRPEKKPPFLSRMSEDLKRDAADAAAEAQGRMTPRDLDQKALDLRDLLGVPRREKKAADLRRLERPAIYPTDPRSLGLGGEEDFVRTPETLPAVPPFVLTDATLPQTPTRFPPPGHPNIPRRVPGRRRETGAPARVPFREGMRVPHMNIPFPEGATPERMDLLGQIDRRAPTPRGVVPKLPKTAGPRRARVSGEIAPGAGMDAEAIAFVEEQKRRTALINKLGPEALRFLQSRIPLTRKGGPVPEGEKAKRVSSWDLLSKERFESLYIQALEYTQGQDAKRKAAGYGLGPAFADRYKNSTPAERAEVDNQQISQTKHQRRRVFLENVLRRWLPETGLLGKRGTGKGTYDEERRIPMDPDKLIAPWVLKWGSGDLDTAIINRRKADDKAADEKFHGKKVEGIKAGQRPGLFIRKASGEDPLIRDVARRGGRGRFGVTGGQFRGAGTVAQGRAAAGVVGRKPGAMTEGRFGKIASVRAEKARRENAAAKARTAASKKRVKKMETKDAWEQRRIVAELPAGATRDDIISAEAQIEFLKKSKDPKNAEKLGELQVERATGKVVTDNKGRRWLALMRISDSMRADAAAQLYPAFVPKLNAKPSGRIDPGPGPQGMPAGGGPFIDIPAIKPTPLDISEQLWEEMGKASEEDQKHGGGDAGAKQNRDQRFVDAFGLPGGPGTYVTKQSWMEAYSLAELKRLRRTRYRIQKGTGKRTKVLSKDEQKKQRHHQSDERVKQHQRLIDAGQNPRMMEKRRKGMAKANVRNAKRLAGINKVRDKKGLPPIGDVDAWGVPRVGWETAIDYGTATANGHNRGGYIRGYNMGGNVDSVNAKLTAGEFVVRREAVDKYGKKFMNDVNLQKLNQGGSYGSPMGGGRSGPGVLRVDMDRAAKLAGDSIRNAMDTAGSALSMKIKEAMSGGDVAAKISEGVNKAAEAITEALSSETLAANLAETMGRQWQETIAATSIDMTGNMGVDVKLSGDGAIGEFARTMQAKMKEAIAIALNNTTNIDGSMRDPSLNRGIGGAN